MDIPTEATVRVVFASGFTLQTVGEGRERLMGAFAQDASIELDFSAVEECDLSGAQLIVAALKTADRDVRRVRIIPPHSGALQRTLSRAGLTDSYEGLAAACAGGLEEGAQ